MVEAALNALLGQSLVPFVATGTWLDLAVGAIIILLLLLWVQGTATRLDRLHQRVEAMAGALDAALVRRAGEVQNLATSGVLDPVTSSLLAELAAECTVAEPEWTSSDERWLAESALSSALAGALDDLDGPEGFRVDDFPQLPLACRGVVTARTVYNAAVQECARRRRTRMVRWLHLAGRAGEPVAVDFDDRLPQALR